MSSTTLDAIRLFVVAYLLLLVLAAVVGRHRPLLSYPFRIGYSLARLLLLVITAKRVRLVPVTTRRHGARKLRKLRSHISRPRGTASQATGTVTLAQDWQAAEEAPPPITPQAEPEEEPEFERPNFEDDDATWNEADDPSAEEPDDASPPPYQFE